MVSCSVRTLAAAAGAGALVFGWLAAPTGAQAPAAQSFSATLYPILENAGCRQCHNPNGVASATRLQFPEHDAPADRIESFGRSLAVLVDASRPDQSLLLNKPTRRIPHTGGERIAPGSPQEQVLRGWIARLARLPPPPASPQEAAGAAPPLSTALRRLTHSQYNNTVRDLLGDASQPANQFPPEDFVNGFKNQYQAQSLSPLLAEAYSAAAEKVARNAFRGGDTLGLVPCRPAAPADPGCAARFVASFGRKAFRRPLQPDEIRRYAALLAGEARPRGGFLAGAQLVVEAMLQSPHFLFRAEGAPGAKSYQRAARLSYFLWDSMPDQALLESAARGELDTPAGLERAARRMLDAPRAQRAVDEFLSQWLRFDTVVNLVKDRRQFPQFNAELARSMTEETRRLASDLVWKDGSFMRLFDADYTFLTADLAALYKLPAPAGEFERVALPPESERAGILGQGVFLAATSKPGETSPTARGLFVREQLLCQQVPEPPPGVSVNLPVVAESRPQTMRQRLAEHLENESCATCHRLIDPIGFGFEKFDPVGARQEKLRLTFFPGRRDRRTPPTSVELELDTRGSVAGLPDSDFSSPRELGRILASSSQCQECVVKQLFRYLSGRQETPADRPVIRRSFEQFRDSQFRFKELMIGLVRWSEFPPGRS